MPKMIFGCDKVPGYGGTNSAAYNLFNLLQRDGFDIAYINLIDKHDSDFYRYMYGENYGNPRALKNVFNCHLQSPIYFRHPELTGMISALKPDLMVGFGFRAALLMKRASRETKMIFFATDCQQMKDALVSNKARNYISHKKLLMNSWKRPKILCREEREAVEIADLIVTHSDSALFLYQKYFPFHEGKIYSEPIWFAEWIHGEALQYSHQNKPFAEREVDALFGASCWERVEKNYNMVREIVGKAEAMRIHVVGEREEEIAGAVHHGLIRDREKFFTLMGNSKAVICPSLFDAAPGILFEASALGCNVVASENCGNSHLCNESLIVNKFSSCGFIEKMDLAVSKPFKDNVHQFLANGSYKNFKETVLAFC
ncbi:hypothetical protein L0222_02935 [bacterium]|nr:hypothetical protein [bacterium]